MLRRNVLDIQHRHHTVLDQHSAGHRRSTFAGAAQNLLGDYLRISPKGVSLVERVFRKGDQKVYLIGMMHIGQSSFYDDLDARIAAPVEGGGKRLVLTEGVADGQGILEEHINLLLDGD